MTVSPAASEAPPSVPAAAPALASEASVKPEAFLSFTEEFVGGGLSAEIRFETASLWPGGANRLPTIPFCMRYQVGYRLVLAGGKSLTADHSVLHRDQIRHRFVLANRQGKAPTGPFWREIKFDTASFSPDGERLTPDRSRSGVKRDLRRLRTN